MFGIGRVRGVGTVICGGVLRRAVGVVGVLYCVWEFGPVKRVFLVDVIVCTIVVGVVDLCLLSRVDVGLVVAVGIGVVVGLLVAVIGIVVGGVGVGVGVIVRWS